MGWDGMGCPALGDHTLVLRVIREIGEGLDGIARTRWIVEGGVEDGWGGAEVRQSLVLVSVHGHAAEARDGDLAHQK